MIHCDLRCANILLTSNLDLKITDFGNSQFCPSSEEVPAPPVVAYFTSPETILRNIFRKETDVWNYGLFFYQLFSGKFPFHSISTPEIDQEVIKYATQLLHFCPRDLWPGNGTIFTIWNQCLEMEYTARPPFTQLVKLLIENKNLF